jgi:hypothetical protein
MMSLHTAMLVGLLAPLVVAILTPFLAVRHVWRDAAGPIGGVITFIAAVHVALAVLDGETPRLFVAQIAEGLALEFACYTAWCHFRFGCVGSLDFGSALLGWLYAR